MHIRLMLPPQIEADWERIGGLLQFAIARDHTRQAIDVFRDLMSGDMALFDFDLNGAAGVVVVEIDAPCFWILYLAGRVAGQPRAWRARLNEMMHYAEGVARAHDCTEMRIEGRDWRRIFPDWEPVAGSTRNELRKAL